MTLRVPRKLLILLPVRLIVVERLDRTARFKDVGVRPRPPRLLIPIPGRPAPAAPIGARPPAVPKGARPAPARRPAPALFPGRAPTLYGLWAAKWAVEPIGARPPMPYGLRPMPPLDPPPRAPPPG